MKISNRLKGLSRKKFVRNVITLATGTVLAQIITMLASPVVTRIYSPTAFGILGVFLSLVALIKPIIALTYPIAIVLPADDEEARGLVKISIIITIFISILTTLLFIIFKNIMVNNLRLDSISPYILFVPLVLLFSGFEQIGEQWLIRKTEFKTKAKINIIQSITLNITKIAIGFFNPVTAVLIFSNILGHFVQSFLLTIKMSKTYFKDNDTFFTQNITLVKNQSVELIHLVKKYKDFPLLRAPESFINAASQSFPLVMLTMFFGPAIAGFFTLSKNILVLPSQLVGKSIGDVFYPRIANAMHKGENLESIIIKATIILFVIGLIPFGTIFFAGPIIFSFIFGSEWLIAGQYARWLALWSIFALANIPSVKALPVLSEQGLLLKFSIIAIVLRVLAILIGSILLNSALSAVMLYSIAGILSNIWLIFMTIKKAKIKTDLIH